MRKKIRLRTEADVRCARTCVENLLRARRWAALGPFCVSLVVLVFQALAEGASNIDPVALAFWLVLTLLITSSVQVVTLYRVWEGIPQGSKLALSLGLGICFVHAGGIFVFALPLSFAPPAAPALLAVLLLFVELETCGLVRELAALSGAERLLREARFWRRLIVGGLAMGMLAAILSFVVFFYLDVEAEGCVLGIAAIIVPALPFLVIVAGFQSGMLRELHYELLRTHGKHHYRPRDRR